MWPSGGSVSGPKTPTATPYGCLERQPSRAPTLCIFRCVSSCSSNGRRPRRAWGENYSVGGDGAAANSSMLRAIRTQCAISLRGHDEYRPDQSVRTRATTVRPRRARALARGRRVRSPLLRPLDRAPACSCARRCGHGGDLPPDAHRDPHRVRGAAEDPRARAAGGGVRVRSVRAGQRAGPARARGEHRHRGRIRAPSARARRARAVRGTEIPLSALSATPEKSRFVLRCETGFPRSTGMPGS